MSSIEKGIVKFFNPAEGKRFGFVHTESGEEIFFHFGDGAQVALGYGFRGEIHPDFVSGKSPNRDPKKGDELVFERLQGRKDKGPKATPWAFALEYDKLAALASRIGRPQYWAEPNFVGFKTESTSGWFPTTYYAYYPASDEAYEAGIHARKFDTLLLYKQGEVVVTGRTVRWHHGESRLMYGKPEEPVNGIIPADAPDGFYFWNGAKWEKCEQVEVRATSVIIGTTETPAHYRFVGLQAKSGQLIPNQEKLVTSQEFFSIREIATHEVTNLQMVETSVRKDGWWSADERHKWLEPNLTEGFAPELEALLDRLDGAVIRKERVAVKDERLRVTIEVPGEQPYELEYNPGHASGDPDDMFGYIAWPTTFLQRSPGRTYVASDWSKKQKADPKWVKLMQLLTKAPMVAGPVEEAMLAKTGNRFYLDNGRSVVDYAVFCGHGFQVTRASEFSLGHLRGNDYRKLLLAHFDTAACPFGCEAHKRFNPELIKVSHESRDLGVSEGFQSIAAITAKMDERDPYWRYHYVCHSGGTAWYYTGGWASDLLDMFEKAQRGEIRVKAKEIGVGEYAHEGSVNRQYDGGWKKYQVAFAVREGGDVEVLSSSRVEEATAR